MRESGVLLRHNADYGATYYYKAVLVDTPRLWERIKLNVAVNKDRRLLREVVATVA